MPIASAPATSSRQNFSRPSAPGKRQEAPTIAIGSSRMAGGRPLRSANFPPLPLTPRRRRANQAAFNCLATPPHLSSSKIVSMSTAARTIKPQRAVKSPLASRRGKIETVSTVILGSARANLCPDERLGRRYDHRRIGDASPLRRRGKVGRQSADARIAAIRTGGDRRRRRGIPPPTALNESMLAAQNPAR